ncbi:MAG: Cna B-type domain-containing protein [Clostridia bacterium]|nr:Cna B-type domain-containing protein [Clostridia bacterium]
MKKSLAVMLALIMVLCMIPTTAFAATMSWEWTVTIIGGNYYRADGTQSNNRYKINQHLDNSVPHEIGYKFEWNASAGGNNYNGGWQLCLTVDGKIVERSTAYIYDRNMSTASDSWTAPASSHTGNSSHPFTLSLRNYPARFQNITLTYDANGGTNAPASDTKQVEKGKSATFTVSSIEPTRENYTFKGWSTNKYATTAEFIGGNSITISQNTTLYAVWANHEHKDENGDGYCDTDHECMHEKDQDGYCIVDGCTHPHEGDGACCPKKSDNKPERPEPENTSKPFIELTGEEAVKVHCTNDKANHDDKSYGLMHDGYTVGEVQGDKESGYTCEITVKPEKYVDQYNLDIEGGHTLVDPFQTGTIHLKYDTEEQKWKLATPSDVPVVFDVKCDNTQPPLDNITIEVSKTWHDDSNTVPKPDKITVLLLADGKEVNRANIEYVNGAWSHSFGAKPANDNGNPINYTVKEEDVPDWTPYYYTAGLWKNLLAFQIHNVPTEKTREIKVTKKVSGDGADKTKEFDFKVTLLEYHNGDGETGVGTFPLGGIYTFGGVTFTKGVATFKLKDGESFEIKGIPSNLQYKVEEVAPSGYTVKVNGSAGSSISGAFTDAKTVNIAFENIKESGTNPTPTPTPTPTPGGGNGGGGHWHPTTTPVPVIVIPPKTGDMTIWQSILHFLGIR